MSLDFRRLLASWSSRKACRTCSGFSRRTRATETKSNSLLMRRSTFGARRIHLFSILEHRLFCSSRIEC